ncbi:MAG TPA: tyrosine-type recombinase/integrase, partial [Bryobacteraceae bacterium]|nr:tyrosine-type recombinase/integrase [Bryobacteraceae bacterium]
MLTAYRRHRATCKFKSDRASKKCRCALWADGTLEGEPYRKSLKTRSFERAQQIIRDIEDGKKPEAPVITIKQAIRTFTDDLQARSRAADTIRKYRLLFTQLSAFADRRGLSAITEFTFDVLVQFRGLWEEKGTATRNKKLDRLKAFFGFAHDAGWIAQNPTRAIKPASAHAPMVKPFSTSDQALLLAKPQTRALKCFVRVLYHSGLRISDACMLRPEDFDGNKIRRVNQKNQETVFIPIPPDLKRELDLLPLNGGYYFLQGQSEKHYTQTDAWRTILNDAFKKDVPGFHAHRFRHTAAVNWLASGLTIEEVAALLGNSVKVVEKHYASFCGARQETVERKLQAIWE